MTLPPGACDAHCHVFGPASRFPYAPDRSYTPPDAPVENLRALHARLGVSRAVIVHASCHGTDMAVTLDAIASSRGAYRGVACVDDTVTERDLLRLHEGGIRGIRFSLGDPSARAVTPDMVEPLAKRARRCAAAPPP